MHGEYGRRKNAEREEFLSRDRTQDCHQRDVFDGNSEKVWWHIEFLSRHEHDLPYREDVTYNTPIVNRKRRTFYLSERGLAKGHKLNRKTIRKHLNNYIDKGMLVVVHEARFAPSMPDCRRATVYALGPNFHHVPWKREDETDTRRAFSNAKRVDHKRAICISTEQRIQDTECDTIVDSEKDDTRKAKSNGKPLPCKCQVPSSKSEIEYSGITDSEIEQINTDVPSYMNVRLFPVTKRERNQRKQERRTKQHEAGAQLYEEVLKNVGKPGETGRCTSEEWIKGIPFHPDYVDLSPVEIESFEKTFLRLDTIRITYVPRRNLPQMSVSDPRRPKCPKCKKQNCKSTMRLALNWSVGTCYWQCPRHSTHQLPISLNYVFVYQRRDGLGNWRKDGASSEYRIESPYQLCNYYMNENDKWYRSLTDDQYTEYLVALLKRDMVVLRRLYDIHVRNDRAFLEAMVDIGVIQPRDVAYRSRGAILPGRLGPVASLAR